MHNLTRNSALISLQIHILSATALAAPMPRATILRVQPIYPVVARQMKIAGTIEVEVTAMANGSARHPQAISGHPMLRKAAEECVAQWRFVMLSGQAHGTVTLIFSLHPED